MTDHCLRSRNLVNVIVAGKQPQLQWLDLDRAIKHCSAGIGIWEWASNDADGEPDVVMACVVMRQTPRRSRLCISCESTCPRSRCGSST